MSNNNKIKKEEIVKYIQDKNYKIQYEITSKVKEHSCSKMEENKDNDIKDQKIEKKIQKWRNC